MFAEVVIPISLPKALTYGVPMEMQEQIAIGKRVEVNVGRNKLYSGLVIALHQHKPEDFEVKPIRSVIDDEPIVTQQQIALWRWIAQYYVCGLGEVMQAALPAHLKLMSETLLYWTGAEESIPTYLSDDAYIIAEALQIRKRLTIDEARQLLGSKVVHKAINELLDTGLAEILEELEERYKEKKVKHVFLHPDWESEDKLQELFSLLDNEPKALNTLITFIQARRDKKGVALPELLKQSKLSRSMVDKMVKLGYFEIREVSTDRVGQLGTGENLASQLSEAQSLASNKIKEKWQNHAVCLLRGLTGSGKTHIYIELIRETIAAGKQALLLMPEIAITNQMLSRLKHYFGEEIGIYHSKYGDNARVEIWKKVASAKYKIVIGPRSAMWLPFQQLGLIIVDEEHDPSFKQHEPAPRYHARDAAIYYAAQVGAKVLLGSATPSIESLYNVQSKKYGFVALSERYLGVSLPEVKTVNAANVQASLSRVITVDLLSAILDTVKEGKQVILFQNKRGYAPFVLCGFCGFVPKCRHCDVSLTYHKATDKLHCHYCGFRSNPINQCPQCGSAGLSARSFGTEKIEEDLARIFPHLKVARMDLDSMRTQSKQLQLLENFAMGRIDILVGTQMVVKGLDFANVGLVGILSADSLLSYPDFRVNERAYQLMEQVSGRAGRSDGKGKVLIQTHQPQHQIIQTVLQHNFKLFYNNEINFRQQFNYPPFLRLIKVNFRHKDQSKSLKAAQRFAEILLHKIPDVNILGPTEALVARVRNQFVYEIMMKLPLNPQFIQMVKNEIKLLASTLPSERGMSALRIIVDVDPY